MHNRHPILSTVVPILLLGITAPHEGDFATLRAHSAALVDHTVGSTTVMTVSGQTQRAEEVLLSLLQNEFQTLLPLTREVVGKQDLIAARYPQLAGNLQSQLSRVRSLTLALQRMEGSGHEKNRMVRAFTRALSDLHQLNGKLPRYLTLLGETPSRATQGNLGTQSVGADGGEAVGGLPNDDQRNGSIEETGRITEVLQEIAADLHRQGSPPDPASGDHRWDTTWPAPGRVTAGYLERPYLMTLGSLHSGIDIVSPQGGPVQSMADGIVAEIAQTGDGFRYLVIVHHNGTASLYGHLSFVFTTTGERVQAGELIALSGGAVGTEGAGHFTTGPHLHLEVFAIADGRVMRQNPLAQLPKRLGDPFPAVAARPALPPAQRFAGRTASKAVFLQPPTATEHEDAVTDPEDSSDVDVANSVITDPSILEALPAA